MERKLNFLIILIEEKDMDCNDNNEKKKKKKKTAWIYRDKKGTKLKM